MNTPHTARARLLSRAHFRAQWWALAAIVSALAAAIGYGAANHRADWLAQERQHLLAQAGVISANVTQQLTATKHMLEGIRDDLPAWRKTNTLDTAGTRRLKAMAQAIPGIRTLNILDAQGTVIHSNRAELLGKNFAGRDYFQRARNQGGLGVMQLSAPFQTALDVYSMNLVIVIPGPHGEFAGAATATLAPEYFTTLLESVRYAPDMRMTLIHENGQLFIQVPAAIQPGVHVDRPGTFFSRHIASQQTESVFTGESPLTSGRRVIAMLTISPAALHMDQRLIVSASRDHDALLAAWRHTLIEEAITLLLLGTLAAIALAVFQHHQRHVEADLTQTKISLDESEERFRQLIGSAPNPMFLVDMTGHIRITNHEAEALFGYPRDEIVGQPITLLIPSRHHQSHAGFHQAFMKQPQSRPMGQGRELFAVKRDGVEIPVEVSLSSVELAGQPAVLATLIDISLRTRIRHAMEHLAYLSPALDPFDAIAQAVHMGLAARWCGVGLLSDDGARVRTLGFWDTDRVGTRFEYDIAGAPSRTQPLAIEHDVATLFPEAHRLADTGAASYRGEPIVDADGRLAGILFAIDDQPCVEDPTERAFIRLAAKRAASELMQQRSIATIKESEDRFRQLADHIHEVFWITDTHKQHIIYISPAYECIWGRSCSSLYARPMSWIEAIHPDDRPRVMASALTQQALGVYDENYRIVRPDGAIRWIRDRAFAVREANGEVSRIVGIAEDITAQQRARAEHDELQSQLRQAQKMEAIGQLTGGIAHDFNNILASVLGYTALTLDRFNEQLPDKARDYLAEVQSAGERARDLVAKMLAYARESASHPRAMDPRPLVNTAITMLAPTLPSSVVVDLQLTEAIPAIMIDPVQLHQVITNLVINARDAMQGQGRIRIGLYSAGAAHALCTACRKAVEGQYVALVVEDDGDGIAEEHMTRIFDPFFTTKQTGKGSGLGLSMVHGIVHEHGGHILVDSAPGHSTTFRVLFPVTTQAADATRAAVAPAARGLAANRRILVVDDEPAIASYLTELLTLQGHAVTAFTDSRAAWQFFEAQPDAVDLVITDQTMPHLTGIDMAQWMRIKRNNLPIILCTGHSESITPESAARLGIGRFFYKPVASSDLIAAIQEIA